MNLNCMSNNLCQKCVIFPIFFPSILVCKKKVEENSHTWTTCICCIVHTYIHTHTCMVVHRRVRRNRKRKSIVRKNGKCLPFCRKIESRAFFVEICKAMWTNMRKETIVKIKFFIKYPANVMETWEISEQCMHETLEKVNEWKMVDMFSIRAHARFVCKCASIHTHVRKWFSFCCNFFCFFFIFFWVKNVFLEKLSFNKNLPSKYLPQKCVSLIQFPDILSTKIIRKK